MIILKEDQIKQNLIALKEGRDLCLCIKDDAYHMGLERIVLIATTLDIHWFAINSSLDARKILKLDPKAFIYMLGVQKDFSLPNQVLFMVDSENDYLEMKKNKHPFFVKLKSNMNRFGMEINLKILTDCLCRGVLVHNGSCELKDKMDLVNELMKMKEKLGLKYLKICIGGSSMLEVNSDFQYRVGEAIYKDAILYEAKVIKILFLKKGSKIGYSQQVLKQDSTVAILDIGYQNGFKRSNEHSFVSIHHKKYPLIGVKCMDYSFVKVDETITPGCKAYLIGDTIQLQDFLNSESLILDELLVKIW